MKKKYLLLILTALLIAAAAAGGTLASGYVESGNVLGAVSEKSLGIAIVSDGGSRAGAEESGIVVVPGAVSRLGYWIQNNQKNGYELYARVDLYFGWSSETLMQDQSDNGYVSLYLGGQAFPLVDSYEKQVRLGDWIVAYCDREQAVLYYTKPMKYGDSTVFLDEIAFSAEMGNQYAGAQFLLDMDVTAVQANNSDEAIAAEWGVYPTIENGIIARVSETR